MKLSVPLILTVAAAAIAPVIAQPQGEGNIPNFVTGTRDNTVHTDAFKWSQFVTDTAHHYYFPRLPTNVVAPFVVLHHRPHPRVPSKETHVSRRMHTINIYSPAPAVNGGPVRDIHVHFEGPKDSRPFVMVNPGSTNVHQHFRAFSRNPMHPSTELQIFKPGNSPRTRHEHWYSTDHH